MNILLFVFILLASTTLFAQVYRPIKNSDSTMNVSNLVNNDFYNYDTLKYANLYNFSCGLKYSSISGYGINLSARLSKIFTVGFCGFITYSEYIQWQDMTKTKEIENEKDILYDFGLELRGNIITTTKTNIFVLLGGYISDDKNKNSYSEIYNKNSTVGVGFGLDWFWSSHFAADFTFGYKFDYIDMQDDGSPSINKKTNIGLGIGFSYHY
jgi:hypothetical protein